MKNQGNVRRKQPNPNCEFCDGEGEYTIGQHDEIQTVRCSCTEYIDENMDFDEARDSELVK